MWTMTPGDRLVGRKTAMRNTNGTFALGNPGGPGRPRRQIEKEYCDALLACVSIEEWKRIVCRAVEDAIDGDHKAREWIGRLLIGDEPIALAEVVEEIEHLKAVLKENRL
jgi:hypothetical protein